MPDKFVRMSAGRWIADFHWNESPKGKFVTVLDFLATYDGLSLEGFCDNPLGAECHRVLKEWLEADRPEDIELFIKRHANAKPGGC